MNEQPTTAFEKANSISLSVRMIDQDNDGYPSLLVSVVPTGIEPTQAAEQGRKLMLMNFRGDEEASDQARIAFYEPDGSIYLQANGGEELPFGDDVINAHLSETWTENQLPDFMERVQKAVFTTVNVMTAAHALSAVGDVSPQKAFEGLMKMTVGATVLSQEAGDDVVAEETSHED